jgi:hypothetical protein
MEKLKPSARFGCMHLQSQLLGRLRQDCLCLRILGPDALHRENSSLKRKEKRRKRKGIGKPHILLVGMYSLLVENGLV